jgi:hypothetical protein
MLGHERQTFNRQERRERFGFSYISAFGCAMQNLAPIVARLSGT